MPPLLYLCHRIPYPPNKGDKIRSFHWLKGLSQFFDIYLAAFVDDKEDWQYVEKLKAYCADCHIVQLDPVVAKLKSMTGLVKGQALTLPYYFDDKLQQWIDQVVNEKDIKDILVFSSSMAQYVEAAQYSVCNRVIDFVDMDSDKWLQYASTKSWPMSWVYQREANRLLTYEQTIASTFDRGLFVSEAENNLFQQKCAGIGRQMGYVNNGVDTDYFSPQRQYNNPYDNRLFNMVFTGAMDYWANVDAVRWFVEDVFQKMKADVPNLQFNIVGSKPTKQVMELQKIKGVFVTGAVDDIRPYIYHAALAVAPMRIARGIQNKVLEAMAMAKLVITSPQGYEGLDAEIDKEIIVASHSDEWIDTIKRYAQSSSLNCVVGDHARSCAVNKYSWQSSIEKLKGYF